MSGILKAFSKVSGKILDAAGLNFGKDLRDMNVSPYHLFDFIKMVSILGHQKNGNERNEDSFYKAFEKNQNENSEKNRQVCC